MKFLLNYSRRIWLLWLLMVLGLCLAAGFQFVMQRLGAQPTAQLRIVSVVQQLLMFMLPAVICALLSTRRPADLLGIRSVPSWRVLALAVLTLIVAIPAINALEQLCELLPWSESIVAQEGENQRTVRLIIGSEGMANTLLAVCVIAVIPGLCEELFFRGALQNLLQSRPMSAHVAVWTAAICFSLLHVQPIGMIPRVILGAGFGYMALWSGSLWTAVVCHMLNNALVVITYQAGMAPENIGLATPALSVASALLASGGLYLIYRNYSRSISRGI